MLRVAVCLAILRAVSTTSTACDPYSFSDLDHDLVCGPCLVLADNMQSFTNCSAYCEAQGLGCVNGWEDYDDDCVPWYEVGCDTTVAWPTTSYYYEANPHSYGRGYGGTGDALCECGTTSQGFFDEDFSYMYEVSSETPCYAICTQFPFIRGLTCEGRATGGCGARARPTRSIMDGASAEGVHAESNYCAAELHDTCHWRSERADARAA